MRVDSLFFPPKPPSKSPPNGAALDALPVELLQRITEYLVGFDLLQLVHTNQRLMYELKQHPQLWTQRMLERHASDVHHALADPQRRYLEDHSLCFRGQDLDAAKRGDRCACVPIEQTQRNRTTGASLPLVLAPQRAVRFSFDAWFSLLSNADDPTVIQGGIILGAQSVQWIHPMVWAHYHQQFLHVDKHRNLYCSVLNGPKEIIAPALQVDRWYHVALTYEDEEQRVFLDGALVHFDEGELHREWNRLEHLQIGTGCISGASVGKPTPKFCGWYGFHGLVDEFRVWNTTLSCHEVASLARGRIAQSPPCYSLKDDQEVNYCGFVVPVQCARPREKYCASVRRLQDAVVAAAAPAPSFWDFEWLFSTCGPAPPALTRSGSSEKRGARR